MAGISIKIKEAGKKDAEHVADFSRKTFYESFAPDNTKENMDKFMEEQFTREALVEEVGAPGNIFLMAFHDHELVGYARLRENNNPPALTGKASLEIARIYASKEMIGKGIGSALMEKSIQRARDLKKSVIWLGVWEKNSVAISFYERWGFEKFDRHTFMLGDDPQQDWLMKKDI